jgi:7-cyano-7-deazaguanine synthase
MKTVLILSGGMDSTTLLYDLMNTHKPEWIKVLSFNYGQRHKKELEFAANTCKKLGVEHHIIDLSNLTFLISNSALTNPNIEVPEGHYEDESMKSTVVPNRNSIMLSIAVGYAESLSFDCVAIANHTGDHSVYPDCRSEFITTFSNAEILGTYNHIFINAPYTHISKADIAEIGLRLGIDYDADTWSCYKGGDEPCHKCGTCVERDEALFIAKSRIIQDTSK